MDYFPISPTRVRALHCGYYFQQRYLKSDRIFTEDEEMACYSLNLHIGSLMHKVLETYVKALKKAWDENKNPWASFTGIDEKVADAEAFNEQFKKAWDAQIYIPETFYEDIRANLLSFVENNPIDPNTLWRVEEKVSLDWELNPVDWESEAVFLRGILDKIDIVPEERLAIATDYKHFLPSEGKLRSSYQTKMYPFLLLQLNPYLENFRVTYHSVKTNKKVSFDFTKSEVSTLEDSLRDLSKRIAKKIADPNAVWKAHTGENCPFCIYRCPLLDVGLEPIKNLEKAKDIAGKLYALKMESQRLLDELKAYLNATDEIVDIGAGIYYMKEIIITRGYKADRAIQVCNDKGFDVNKILKVDTEKLKKVEDEEVLALIKEGTKDSISRRITFEEAREDIASGEGKE